MHENIYIYGYSSVIDVINKNNFVSLYLLYFNINILINKLLTHEHTFTI